jgi:hypothetical protein
MYHKKVWMTTHILRIIKIQTKRQKKARETTKETSGCMRLEWVIKWPTSMIAR